MSEMTLTKIRMRDGVWEGRIDGVPRGVSPNVGVRYLDSPVGGVKLAHDGDSGHWDIAVVIPVEALSEGVHTFLVTDESNHAALGSFTLIAGEPAADDLRAEVDLLRAELDMLKRAFRRHCLETM